MENIEYDNKKRVYLDCKDTELEKMWQREIGETDNSVMDDKRIDLREVEGHEGQRDKAVARDANHQKAARGQQGRQA